MQHERVRRVLASSALVLLSTSVAACGAGVEVDASTSTRSNLDYHGAPIGREEVVERGLEWPAAAVPYCGGLPGGGDLLCGGTCYRGAPGSKTRRADWDRYRSDCSGLVSYAWGLAPPGLTTYGLPNVSARIDLDEILPGDIFLNTEHTMLFVGWASAGVARFAEEPTCGLTARVTQAGVSRSGGRVAVARYGVFDVRRYDGIRDAPAVPFEEGPRPVGGPFEALEIRAKILPDLYFTQCDERGDGERVWQSLSSGPNPDARWATARYPQRPSDSCGAPREGVYPIVARSLARGELGAWIVHCTGSAREARVFHAEREVVDGHPAAVYSHTEVSGACP